MPRSPPARALLPALALLAAAGPVAAPAQPQPQPRSAPLVDHRDLKRYRREIAEDRRGLERLRSRVVRLDALRAARALDVRAVDELDRKVHAEMLREARAKLLEARPRLGHAARAASPKPIAGGSIRFFTAADEARVDQITVEWAALRGRTGRADLDRRRALLAELAELYRVELEDDLRAYREKGGDPEAIPELPEGDEGDAAAEGRAGPPPRR